LRPKEQGLITPLQRELLGRFFALPDSGSFYLTGGTALAEYYLGHRKSFDLDLFCAEKSLIIPFSRNVEAELGGDFHVTVVRRFETFVELVVESKESVKIQMAFDSPFRFEPPVEMADHILVNDFRDLSADKLLAFFGRTEPRDAVDIHFILKNVDLATLQESACRKDPGFDPYWLSVAFSRTRDFPDDISQWPVEMVRQCDAREIKRDFARLAIEVMRSIRNPGR
jgi:hypothetical protein